MEADSIKPADRGFPGLSLFKGAHRLAARWPWLGGLLIGLLGLTLNLAGNNRTGLWDRDEPRYAVAVREMRASGNWIVPTFNGEPRYHKPILIYWLMGAATALAGESTFGLRLVSALAGAGTCVLTWGLGRRMLGARGGALAGVILAVSPIMVAESKLATTDATLALLVGTCLFCLHRLAEQNSARTAAVFWVSLSLSVLLKGPAGPLLVGTTAGMAWWLGWPLGVVGRRLAWRRGLLVFLVLNLPWFVLIGVLSRGDFFRFAVGKQLLPRVTSSMEQHGAFPGYYLLLSVLAMYPWSALMPAAVRAAWPRRKTVPNLAFLLGWAIGPWLVLEALPTRLLHYYLPAYPTWALLAAWLVESVSAQEVSLRRWPLGRLGLGMLAGVGLGGVVVALAIAITVPGPLRLPLCVFAGLLAVGTLAGTLCLHRAHTRQAVVALGTAWALIMLLAGGWLIPAAEPYRMSRRIGERLAALEVERGMEPVLLDYHEPGVHFALGHLITEVRDRRQLEEMLDRAGTLLTVVTPAEAAYFGTRFGLAFETIESHQGFSQTKGRGYTLQIAAMRKANRAEGTPSWSRGGDQLQQPLVK